MVAFVDVGRDELGALGVGAGDEEGRDAANIRREARGTEIADMGLGRDQHLTAEMAAFLLGGELVLEMDPGGARDRKSTRLTPVTNARLVCRLLIDNKKTRE